MIEQMLMRIAKRGPGLTQLESGDVSVTPSSYGSEPALAFPLRRTPAEAPDSVPYATNMPPIWEAAKDAHYRNTTPLERARALPSAYAEYDAVHAMIGGLIWSERKYIQKNIVHIVSRNGDVVAAVYPGQHTVAVRKRPAGVTPGMLSIKALPASAQPFESDEANNFDTTTVQMLLWYYGQVVPEAVENIPNELLRGKILLRKLPLVAPNALSMRHLHLIHLFSGGPFSVPALFSLLKPESLPSICADLTSLFLTGCLVSMDAAERPV